MSMSGSLMGYENNNEVGQAKCSKKNPKALPVATSVNAAGVTSPTGHGSCNGRGLAGRPRSFRASGHRRKRRHVHVNGLWSLWYGIIAVAFQAYIATRCTKRFIAFLSLPWPADAPPPKVELHACLAMLGAGVLLLPILLATAFLKLGNLANDGIKLGRHLSTCSKDPPSSLLNGNSDSGLGQNLWRHGGPTSALVHLCTAMCFLLPSLLMEARLIHSGFLPKEAVWRTDLDWVMVHRDRLVVLNFMNIPENFSLNLGGQQGYTSQPPYLEEDFDGLLNGTGSSGADPGSTETNTRLTSLLLPSSTGSSSSSSSSSEAATFPNTDTDDYSSRYGSGLPSPSSAPTSASSNQRARATNSRMNARNVQRNRPKSKKNSASSRSRQSGPTSSFNNRGNMSALSLPLTFNSLDDLDHPESLSQEIDENNENYGPLRLEYVNYAMALIVYSVRYPAVFWATNKALGTVFSILLVFNAAQSLLAYAGMSVLYKVQVVGPLKVLPLLRHRSVPTVSTITNLLGDRFFLLNPHVTLGLFCLSTLMVLFSSMVMYLYAYGRYALFLHHERERRIILSKDSRADDTSWTYMTHPAALCVFLAMGICGAPLVYDYSVVYRGSLDGAVLACIVGTILHLGLWLVFWIGLAFKRHWTFKIRVTIAKATVKSARSLKLVTDVDLMGGRDDDDGSGTPLLVVGNGRTYTVAETSPKKVIMGVIQKAAMERRARSQGSTVESIDGGDAISNDEEQIYWLRPKLRPSPVQSSNQGNPAVGGASGQSNEKGWLNKKLKQKVTFNDLPSTSGSRNKGKARRDGSDGRHEDDGDYATLRELPVVADLPDDTTSEEKLLECVNDDQVTYYASGHRDLQPSEGEPSPPLLSLEQSLPDPPPSGIVGADGLPLPLPPPSPTSISAAVVAVQEASVIVNSQISGTTPQTPRCLRRADSGMPHDELTPRSDSSNSPPLDSIIVNGNGSNGGHMNCGASNNSTSSNSETSSSGVHSNASNASSQRRATSVEDLCINEPREEPQWRSCSLQRGIQPPTATTNGVKSNNPGRVIANPGANYASSTGAVSSGAYVNHVPIYNGEGCPGVILENEATVVIRRKNSRTKLQEPGSLTEEPFGRSTNMRMTSFTESNDLRGIQASSATLPHYPTQPMVTYPHCSTMPLPHASSMHGANIVGNSMNGASGSCGSVPRHPGQLVMGQQQPPPPVHGAVPSHTTLPSHHNGVRLMLQHATGSPNPFVKRFPTSQLSNGSQQPWSILPGNGSHHHHTFSQAALAINGKLAPALQQQHLLQQQQLPRHSDRDSANFSMASSGDSDTCLPH